MQTPTKSMISNMLLYPPQYKQKANDFKKRLSIAEFKNITPSRVKDEYSILSSSELTDDDCLHSQQKNKDRYADIFTYKHNKVNIGETSKNFYVNGSYMNSVVDGQPFAIFAQAPIQNAWADFWIAVIKNKVKKIIMLCSFVDPKRGKQAEKYWPQAGVAANLVSQFGTVSIQTLKQEKIYAEYSKTTIRLGIKGQQSEAIVEHLHWTGWSDMKKPLGEESQQLFQELVGECLQMIEKKEMFMVHCSAGVGRTGTLGAMIEAKRCMKTEGALSLFEIVDNLRRYRMLSVQTFEQYCFVYQQLQKYL